MEPAPATRRTSPEAAFRRGLRLPDATMLVVGSMIGSGIFIVSADIARIMGSPGWLLLVWLASGVLTMIGALSYGELAAMYPRAGGQYVFLREGLGPLPGYLYGWTLFLVIQTGTIAAVAVASVPGEVETIGMSPLSQADDASVEGALSSRRPPRRRAARPPRATSLPSRRARRAARAGARWSPRCAARRRR